MGQLGPHLKAVYDGMPANQLTTYGTVQKDCLRKHVFSMQSRRSVNDVEKSMIQVLQNQILDGEIEVKDIKLACNVAVGQISENDIVMGVIESAIMTADQPVNDDGAPLYLNFTGEKVWMSHSIVNRANRVLCLTLP